MSRLGIFDSGIGGLTTYSHIRKYTDVDIVYLADDEHAPYGDKTRGELFHSAIKCIDTLILYGCDTIVIACNTMTATLKPALCRRYPSITFVGTEPALFSADRYVDGYGKIALMCTPNTANSDRVRELIGDCKSPIDVYAMQGLASYVEKYIFETDMLRRYVRNITPWLCSYQAVVLGCTHYVYLEGILHDIYPHLRIFDGNDGVARRVNELVRGGSGSTIFLTTSGLDGSYMRHIVDRCT